ncbi:tetraspanin-18-like [Mercenaria mercenaria]|uniref:tetraspanin-18-like n=1 Tax=Mercenaria mercenaria TaxID=6596 RepID=UPI00234E7770|nr:tetraspanin-18-like [Mercenaria mercenaria]
MIYSFYQNERCSRVFSAPFPVGVLAPVQTIADQIAALSKKKEKPLEIGQIPMSACARSFLILSNIIFLIVGGGLSGVGVWMMTDPKIETYFDILNVDQSSSSFKRICYALLAVGIFALLVAFLGCCGAVQKSKCLLTLFLILVGVITVMEAGLGVMVVVSKDSATAIPVLSALMSDMQDKLRTQLKQSVTEHYLPDTLLGTTWDNVQIELECCGATGPEDYKNSRWTNETRPETDYPDTCCVLMSKEAAVPEPSNKLLCHFGTAGFYFETGCYDKMIGWFQDNSMYIIASAGAVFVIEVVGFVSAFIICKNGIKKKSKESRQQSAKPAER